MTDDAPHLRQIAPEIITDLCNRAEALDPYSHATVLESRALRDSKTPWDATRLANAIAILFPNVENAADLVRDLDAAAEGCAGLVPSNKHQRKV